ncbi:olfactory receptor 5AP2-like [Rhineura floridana]|uniref:olfactory receptor 5AP2-like n=1 Tax=Rhineura floridana TaxID=261503 RepID=UPI002AC82300|nr:olfactory receptor 5AP2-like [Rhineura floridana]
MPEGNDSTVTEFILRGLTDRPELQGVLFVIFLILYLITVVGNLGMITLIRIDPRLHTPMYFFLSHLAFLDFSYSSAITPKTLMNLLVENKAISYSGCAAQMYSFIAFGTTECFLLAVMAYDRYVAICKPLLYSVIMSRQLCLQLLVGSYICGFVISMIHTGCAFRLSFCRSNVINHFFCDVIPLLNISCSDTRANEIILFAFCIFNGVFITLEICISYLYIVSAILKIHSSKGRRKAFSTCTSHLAVVVMFFGTAVFMYMRPSSDSSPDEDRIVSVFYTVVNPMLNPLIYSLRNKEVKDALKRVLNRKNRINSLIKIFLGMTPGFPSSILMDVPPKTEAKMEIHHHLNSHNILIVALS